jgi:tetratricopeptide (TPR) repeat protein
MIFLKNLLGMLAFRAHALRAQAERRALAGSFACFIAGFFVYDMVHDPAYERLELISQQYGLLESYFDLGLVRILIFLMLIFVPGLIILSNAISGDGIGLSFSRREYFAHISVLFPLWGMLYLFTAPIQWFVPYFLGVAENPTSIGAPICLILFRLILMLAYTLWAVKKLNYLSLIQALGVLMLSCFAFLLYIPLASYLYSLPIFFLIPLFYFGSHWIRSYFAAQARERAFQQNLHTLTINPQDADAHYQLGLIHLERRNSDAAGKCFEKAIGIDACDPDYHYFCGRAFELKEEWESAREQYEETYRLNPNYRLGDIFREVGKGYLNTGNIEKGIEFLNFFLTKRDSDPEGRYWLAIALQKAGDVEQMRFQLHTILQQARSNPRFFRKGNREWVYRARMMIRNLS